jgi:hypothetical protein
MNDKVVCPECGCFCRLEFASAQTPGLEFTMKVAICECWHPNQVHTIRDFLEQTSLPGDSKTVNRNNDCPLYTPNRRTRLAAWLVYLGKAIRKVMGK